MSIYWLGRDGQTPPPHARFHFLPFRGQLQTSHLIQTPLPPPTRVKIVRRTFLPTKKEWIKRVDIALKSPIQKVVLARAVRLELAFAPDPFAIAAALKREGAFVFCVSQGTQTFLGATPERLFKRMGRQILSEAVAGTRPRGKTAVEEEVFCRELLNSAKDLSEFSPVKHYVKTTLSPLCEKGVEFTSTSVHKTDNVQHLYAQCEGRLLPSITDEEILRQLHPTPALCGLPKEEAFSLIEKLEPFERGLYGGVIGWSTPEESEWIVGIRSCLVEGNIVTLFSGAGIVDGSDGEKEWEELNQKLKLYDAIFFN